MILLKNCRRHDQEVESLNRHFHKASKIRDKVQPQLARGSLFKNLFETRKVADNKTKNVHCMLNHNPSKIL